MFYYHPIFAHSTPISTALTTERSSMRDRIPDLPSSRERRCSLPSCEFSPWKGLEISSNVNFTELTMSGPRPWATLVPSWLTARESALVKTIFLNCQNHRTKSFRNNRQAHWGVQVSGRKMQALQTHRWEAVFEYFYCHKVVTQMRDTAQAPATRLCRMSSGRWFWDPLEQKIDQRFKRFKYKLSWHENILALASFWSPSLQDLIVMQLHNRNFSFNEFIKL